MSVSEFTHIMHEIEGYTDHIYLHLKGEPTLHPELKAILDKAYHHQKKVHLVTNGTLLSQLTFDLVAHPALVQLSISLHSILAFKDTDKGNYFAALQNILTRSEDKDFSLFLRVWNEDNSEIMARLKHHFGYDFKYQPNKHRIRIRKNLALDFDQAFLWPSIRNPFISNQGRCYGGIKMMGILADGTLTPCCLDSEGELSLGNIYTGSFKDLITSSRYLSFTQDLALNQLREELCQHCTYHLKHKKRLA